jgi:hypothetical protein
VRGGLFVRHEPEGSGRRIRARRDKSAQTVEAGEVFAAEDDGAEAFVAETIGVFESGEIQCGVAGRAGGDFVGEQNFEDVACGAAVENADAALFDQMLEMEAHGRGTSAETAGETAIGHAGLTVAFEMRVAKEMVVEGAFAGAKVQGGDEAVFDVAAELGEVGCVGQGNLQTRGQVLGTRGQGKTEQRKSKSEARTQSSLVFLSAGMNSGRRYEMGGQK